MNYHEIEQVLLDRYHSNRDDRRPLMLARKVRRHVKRMRDRRKNDNKLRAMGFDLNRSNDPVALARHIVSGSLRLLIVDFEFMIETYEIYEVGLTHVVDGQVHSRNLRIAKKAQSQRFKFGESERVTRNEAGAIVRELIDQSDLIISYGGNIDLNLLAKITGDHIDHTKSFDASILSRHKVDNGSSKHLSLRNFARACGVNAIRMHNGGNDARYTYEALKHYAEYGGMRHIPDGSHCALCNGTGLHDDNECPACGGTGEYGSMIERDYAHRPGAGQRSEWREVHAP